MDEQWRRGCILLALVGVLALAGCGGQRAAASPRGTATPATASQTLTALHVLRTSPFPPNHIPPFERTVVNPAKVQRLYATLHALKPLPPGNYSCPDDFGIQYQLTFFRGQTIAWKSAIAAGGCSYLVFDDAFWVQFADTLGVPESVVYPIGPQPSGPSAPTPVR